MEEEHVVTIERVDRNKAISIVSAVVIILLGLFTWRIILTTTGAIGLSSFIIGAAILTVGLWFFNNLRWSKALLALGLAALLFPTFTAASAWTTSRNSAIPVVDTNTILSVNKIETVGIELPMESWYLIKAGSIISGDVAIADIDNNNKKWPLLYDNKEVTADIVLFSHDTYVWLEWGGFLLSSEELSSRYLVGLINKKLTEFSTVRFLVWDGNQVIETIAFQGSVTENIFLEETNEFFSIK